MSDSIQLVKFAGLLRSGVSLDQALSAIGGMPSSAGLRFLIDVAIDSGSAVADEFEAVAELVKSRERLIQRVDVAHASPKATARLVIWLPVLILIMAQLVGWNVLDSILGTPIVFLSLSCGLVLLLVAKLITSKMLSRAKPTESYIGFFLMGVAIESSAGSNLAKAKDRTLNIYQEVFGCLPAEKELEQLVHLEKLVNETGARVSGLLLRQAQSLQEAELVRTEIKIEKLGVRLMLPLGLGVLPAFVLLAIVPLMVTTLGTK
jgi:tight adherence protein B